MTNRARTKLDNLSLAGLDPQDHIATNFRVYELSRCEVAARLGIDNALPDDQVLRAAVQLVREVMQPIREAHGRFSPISLYRCQALERVLKKSPPDWISLSPHTGGWACDLRIPGLTTLALAQWASTQLPAFDEVCCECVDPDLGPSSGWVHIALRPTTLGPNRGQLRSQIRDRRNGRWVIVEELQDQIA